MMSGVYFFIGILSFILVSAILSLTLVLLGKGISYSRAESEKTVPYECGELPVVPTKKVKFSANYYGYALAFLIFDVEAALLIPWIASFDEHGMSGLVATAVFLFILLVGLFYAFKSGGLRWE